VEQNYSISTFGKVTAKPFNPLLEKWQQNHSIHFWKTGSKTILSTFGKVAAKPFNPLLEK
jgi:hypothetical protein